MWPVQFQTNRVVDEVTSRLEIVLFPVDRIKPTEAIQAMHANKLRRDIEISGFWTHPVLVDEHKSALMDGHHRYHAAVAMGLKLVPAISMSYDDPAIELSSWRPNQVFTPQMIWDICDSGQLLPMKSTRHIINIALPFSRVPIDRLKTSRYIGEIVPPATPSPSRVQILSSDYHQFGERLGIRTFSGARLDVETPNTIVPHSNLRLTLERDPSMAALLNGAPCHIALGRQSDFPFRLLDTELLLLPPSLLDNPRALAAAGRWGLEAAFALQANDRSDARFASLLRHGAALIRQLPPPDRTLALTHLPEPIAMGLMGGELSSPGSNMLDWVKSLITFETADFGFESVTTNMMGGIKSNELERPLEQVLVSNGDSRLEIDRLSGKNRYGTTPRPRPEAAHFSSSTASSISDYGFLFCDVLRRDLLNSVAEDGLDIQSVRAKLSDAIIGELRDMCGLGADEADGAIAPSGTDTELLAVMLARCVAPDAPLTNILISVEETGRGVKLAGAGKYFDELSATGAPIEKGSDVWPGAKINVVNINIRDELGNPIPTDELDEAFMIAGLTALERGDRVLAHCLAGSKTGLSGPSKVAIERLIQQGQGRVDVVVDACQMRTNYDDIAEFIRRGWMVQVSGSKSLTGPPFSGAILIPTSLRDRRATCLELMRPGIGYPEDWSLEWADAFGRSVEDPQLGAAFRWLPALLEAKLLNRVPHALRNYAVARFRDAVVERLESSVYLKPLSQSVEAASTAFTDDDFARHSIVSFKVFARQPNGELEALDESDCRRIFELLNKDASHLLAGATPEIAALLAQECHIGQPVALGEGAYTYAILRLVIGMRFFNIVGHAGPGAIFAALESEISDLIRAIDKLEALAQHWWSFRSDVI